MRPAFRCGVLAFALAVLAGCGQREDGGAGQAQAALAKPSASAAAEPAVARLGALQVAPDELKALLAEVPAETRVQLSENRDALERWMRARLAEKALYEQASAQDWQQRPQVKTLIDAAARQIVLRTYLESVSTVPEDYPSDAELQAAYQANKAQLAVPALYRVSQIFIAASAAGGLAEARKRAQELYRQAADGDFAELARKHSDDPQTARNGGDIGGLLAQAQLLPAIRPALERLKVGAVSEPIQGANGFHLVKLTERRDARLATLDEVRGRLRESLRAQRQEQIAKAYLDGLVNNATLSIDGALLGKDPGGTALMGGTPEARRGPRASRWRHLRSWLFGEPERFRDERQRLWGAYAAWLGEQVQQRLGEDAETAPRLLAFLESRRAAGQLPNTDIDLRVWLDERGWIVRLACLRSDAEPIENELRRALMDRSLRLPPPEHMPQPIELRIRLMPGR